jgi:hypothetical protein
MKIGIIEKWKMLNTLVSNNEYFFMMQFAFGKASLSSQGPLLI